MLSTGAVVTSGVTASNNGPFLAEGLRIQFGTSYSDTGSTFSGNTLNGVIRAQVPTAIPLLIANILILYLAGFHL